MKKFLNKLILLTSPFVLMVLLNITFLDLNQGDLNRMAGIYWNERPKEDMDISHSIPERRYYDEDYFKENKEVDILNIGDSFSNQTFPNYLNNIQNKNCVNISRLVQTNNNPFEYTINLIESGFFVEHKVDALLIEVLDVTFISRLNEDFELSINKNYFSFEGVTKKYKYEPFSKQTLLYPYNNLKYIFGFSNVAKDVDNLGLNSNKLFSNNLQSLLFYSKYQNVEINKEQLFKAIEVLKDIKALLKEHNIELVLVLAPNKFDFYCENLDPFKKCSEWIKDIYYELENAQIHFLNTHKILGSKKYSEKDLFYYDDTHWTYKASDIVGENLKLFLSELETD